MTKTRTINNLRKRSKATGEPIIENQRGII